MCVLHIWHMGRVFSTQCVLYVWIPAVLQVELSLLSEVMCCICSTVFFAHTPTCLLYVISWKIKDFLLLTKPESSFSYWMSHRDDLGRAHVMFAAAFIWTLELFFFFFFFEVFRSRWGTERSGFSQRHLQKCNSRSLLLFSDNCSVLW